MEPRPGFGEQKFEWKEVAEQAEDGETTARIKRQKIECGEMM